MANPVRVGVVGLGGFGQFVMAALADTPEARVVAVHDVDPQRARTVADKYRVAVCTTFSELAVHPEVEVVYLATPPAQHGLAALQALRGGKHLFVEKPLAISGDEAEQVATLAATKGLRVGVNYVLRFNPIYRLAVELGRSGLLGDLRHMSLENDASDEGLPPGHWFWNPAVSGSILVEHGVHFFDIARQLAGTEGTHEYTEAWVRAPHGFTDRVLSVVRFGEAPATFYHAFDKPGRIERTEFRLAYDTGYVAVKGWMPVELALEAVLDRRGVDRLQQVAAAQELDMGAGRSAPIRTVLDLVEPYVGSATHTRGRGLERTVSHRVRMCVHCPEGKQSIYTRTVQAGFADLARSVREPGYRREVTLEHAVSSLRLALEATEKAQKR